MKYYIIAPVTASHREIMEDFENDYDSWAYDYYLSIYLTKAKDMLEVMEAAGGVKFHILELEVNLKPLEEK